jgi:putative DNA primase/helicase
MSLTNSEIKAEILNLAESTKLVDFRVFSGLPVLTKLSDVAFQTVTWLWVGFVALGKLCLLIGNAGVGKTFFLCDLIARITRGEALPGDSGARSPASVILIAPEDGVADTLKARLVAAGAAENRVIILSGVWVRNKSGVNTLQAFDLQHGLPALIAALDQHPDVRLIVIDPITAVLGNTDANDAIEVRAVLQPLITLAENRNIAVVGSTHLSKASDRTAMQRALGTGAFMALSRTAFLVAPDRNDEKRRYLLPVKNNLAKKPPARAYSLQPSEIADVPHVVWETGTVEIDADQALADSESLDRADSKSADLREALRVILEDGEWHPKEDVVEALRKGLTGKISETTIKRARQAIGAKFKQEGFPAKSFWQLPIKDDAS